MMLNTRKKLPSTGIDKILIRGTNWIGDAIMTLPAVASVRAAYPKAHLAILAKPPVSDIYKMFTGADEIIPFESKDDTALGVFRVATKLRAKKFDAAILLQNAIEAAIIVFAARIRVRAGYNTDGRGLLLSHPVYRSKEILKVHQVDYYLEMVKALGCANVNRTMHLETFISPVAASDIRRKFALPQEIPLIGVAPGATYGPAKRWLPDRFAQAADRLASDLGGQAVIFGGKGDIDTAREVASHSPSGMANLTGVSSLTETVYLLSQCRVVVSNDSGLMHVAAALNVPTVAVFGSTNPVTTSPAGLKTAIVRKETPCSPCLKKVCPTDFRCMTAITVDDVVEAAKNLLSKE